MTGSINKTPVAAGSPVPKSGTQQVIRLPVVTIILMLGEIII